MKATRRRQRKPDPLANPEAVRTIFENLRERLPFPIPKLEKELIRFFYAIGYVERWPATDTGFAQKVVFRLCKAAEEKFLQQLGNFLGKAA